MVLDAFKKKKDTNEKINTGRRNFLRKAPAIAGAAVASAGLYKVLTKETPSTEEQVLSTQEKILKRILEDNDAMKRMTISSGPIAAYGSTVPVGPIAVGTIGGGTVGIAAAAIHSKLKEHNAEKAVKNRRNFLIGGAALGSAVGAGLAANEDRRDSPIHKARNELYKWYEEVKQFDGTRDVESMRREIQKKLDDLREKRKIS